MKPNDSEHEIDELVAMLDSLIASGTQHINLEIGDATRVQTVNSRECGRLGACAQPNFDPDDEQEYDEESDDDDF